MGAAIPQLMRLALALPPILPFDTNAIRIEYTTDTVQVHDEVIPDDDEEDISYQTRGKSQLMVVFTVPDVVGKGKATNARAAKKGDAPPVDRDVDEPMEAI